MSKKLSKNLVKSKKLNDLFHIEKSGIQRTLHNTFNEILKITSSICNKKITDHKEEVLKFLNLLTIKERYELRGSHTFETINIPLILIYLNIFMLI